LIPEQFAVLRSSFATPVLSPMMICPLPESMCARYRAKPLSHECIRRKKARCTGGTDLRYERFISRHVGHVSRSHACIRDHGQFVQDVDESGFAAALSAFQTTGSPMQNV
jgi:hypothetical protein